MWPQPGCFQHGACEIQWLLPLPGGGNWIFPPIALLPQVVLILTGMSHRRGFPRSEEPISFLHYKNVLLVQEFGQRDWFRALKVSHHGQILWRFPICGVFSPPYWDTEFTSPQFFVQSGNVLARLSHPGQPIYGRERQQRKQNFLIIIFDADHPNARRIPVSRCLPRPNFRR